MNATAYPAFQARCTPGSNDAAEPKTQKAANGAARVDVRILLAVVTESLPENRSCRQSFESRVVQFKHGGKAKQASCSSKNDKASDQDFGGVGHAVLPLMDNSKSRVSRWRNGSFEKFLPEGQVSEMTRLFPVA